MRHLLAVAVFLTWFSGLKAQTFADKLIAYGNCEPILAVSCPSGVENADYMVDNNPDNYALLKVNLGLSIIESTAFVEVGFSKLGTAGSEVGVIIELPDEGISPQILNSMTVIVYDSAGNEVIRRSDISLTDVKALGDGSNRKVVGIGTPLGNYKIGKFRMELAGMVNASMVLAAYGVFYNNTCPAVLATTVLASRNCTTPEGVVDNDTATTGLLSLPIGLLDSAYVTVQFDNAAFAGDYIGFEVSKSNSALQLGTLDSIQVVLYNEQGEEIGRKVDFTADDLVVAEDLTNVLGGIVGVDGPSNNNFIIGFNSSSSITSPIKSVKLLFYSSVGLLLDLKVHRGLYYSKLRGLKIKANKSGIIAGQGVQLTAEDGFSDYRWSTGETGRVIQVDSAGIYTVTATRFDGCTMSGSYNLNLIGCQTSGRVYADSLAGFGNCQPPVLISCPSGVENPENAVDSDLSNYALMTSSLGVSLIESTSFIDLGFSNPGKPGDKIGLVIQTTNQDLSANVVDNLTVYLIGENGDTIRAYDGTNLQNAGVLSGTGNLSVIELSTPVGTYKIKRIQLSLEGVAAAFQEVAVYGVYYDCACPALLADTLLAHQNVIAPVFAVDDDQSNYAALHTLIGSGSISSLKVGFTETVSAGDYVGFQVMFGNTAAYAGLVDSIKIVVYDVNNNVVYAYSDFKLTDLVLADQVGGTLGSILGTGQGGTAPFVLGAITPAGNYQIGGIEIAIASSLTVEQDLLVFNGFAITQLQGVAIASTDSISCEGNPVTLSAPAGYAAYFWTTGATSQSIIVTKPGLYGVTVSREDGCNLSGSYLVQSRNYGFSFTTVSSNCQSSNGSATVQVSGGSGNYTYEWSNGDTSATANNLSSGFYSVIVTDTTLGCLDTGYVSVSDSTTEFVGYVRHATCGENNGAIFLTVPSSSTILWTDGSTEKVRTNLAPGDYTVTVTDSAGCKRIKTFTVLSRSDFDLSAMVTPASCFSNNGAINLSVSVPGNYSFLWSNGATTEDISNLAPDMYSVTVTNLTTGCQDILFAEVSDAGGPTVNLVTSKEETCARDEDGLLEIQVISPFAYTIQWNNDVTTERNEHLGPGIYKVTVTSGICSTVKVYELIARDAMTVSLTGSTSVCEPPFTGTLVAQAVGGRPSYNFLYNTGDTTATVSGVAPGDYAVQVTDVNGCAKQTNANVAKDASCDEGTGGGGKAKSFSTELITPNGDNFNDRFTTNLIDDYPNNTLEVYTRDGVLVFEGNNYKNNWAGTYKNSGTFLPDGTYFWVFTPKGINREFRGFVVVKH